MTVYMGVDPGKTGSVASLSEDGSRITISDFEIDPLKRIDSLSLQRIFDAVKSYHEDNDIICCLEKSQAMPGQGVVGMFSYGVTYGIILATLNLCDINVVEITPQKWKKEFDLNSNKKLGIIKTKEDSVNMAVQLFPSRKEFFMEPKKKEGHVLLHGRSDAILIAEYCRRVYGKTI